VREPGDRAQRARDVLAQNPGRVSGQPVHNAWARLPPALQCQVMDQVPRDAFVLADTRDFWIELTRPDLERLIRRVDLFVLNENEAEALSGEKNLIVAGLDIRKMGPRIVIVKKGSHGSLLFIRTVSLRFPPIRSRAWSIPREPATATAGAPDRIPRFGQPDGPSGLAPGDRLRGRPAQASRSRLRRYSGVGCGQERIDPPLPGFGKVHADFSVGQPRSVVLVTIGRVRRVRCRIALQRSINF